MVRSNRGRSAALRHIWAWPVHSARRFAITLIALVLVIVVGGKVSRTVFADPGSPAPRPAATVTTSTPAPLPSVTATVTP
jgi:hypothetical protein